MHAQIGRLRTGRGGFLALILLGLALLVVPVAAAEPPETEPVPGGSLDPRTIPKYVEPLVIPPAMPLTATTGIKGKKVDYYEIVVKQFRQFILPKTWSAANNVSPTTVWSFASAKDPRPAADGGTLNYPSFTIEASWKRPVRVKWINGLVDANGNYLPHILPVDQTLHWANPAGGPGGTDTHGMVQDEYKGPVPMVVHVHGAHTTEDSDGYPEAWYLPAAKDIPAGYATGGTFYEQFKKESRQRLGVTWQPGTAVFQYPNDQRASTLWYHDHSLGMTRVNVYAGPAGFYLIRGGPDDMPAGKLPGPAPQRGDAAGKQYREIPIAIQDRSFNADGSLFYPDNRAFFEGLNVPGQEPKQFPDAGVLDIPFIPDMVPGGGHMSDISPIWNPEFFGNTMVVNGRTWPYLQVEQQRYRFRFLNGTQSRFLILEMENGMPFWQIGTEGGFLPNPVRLTELLLGPAERADVIVDFTNVPAGTRIVLKNVGPDEPFGGGEVGEAFEPSDPGTTGQVMQFRVVARQGADTTVPPSALRLPQLTDLPVATKSRDLSLNEMMSMSVNVNEEDDSIVYDADGEPFGPQEALLGTFDPSSGTTHPMNWMDPVTETVKKGSGGAVGLPQPHRRCASHPRPPGAVPGGESRGDGHRDVAPRRHGCRRGASAGALGGGVQRHGHRLPR